MLELFNVKYLGYQIRVLLLVSLILITGCSTLSTTTNYEIVKDERFERTYVYDWCEENQIFLGFFPPHCMGRYNPPVYSIESNGTNYIFYPMRINQNDIAIGPIIFPVIYTDYYYPAETLKYKVRSLDKNKLSNVKPLRVDFYINGLKESNCLLQEQENDGVSNIFTCNFKIDSDNVEKFYSLLTLSDNTEIKISYTKNKFWSYRPLVAPAGRAGNSGKYIEIED